MRWLVHGNPRLTAGAGAWYGTRSPLSPGVGVYGGAWGRCCGVIGVKVNRSLMAQRRRTAETDALYYRDAIPGIPDARLFRWILDAWAMGHDRGHACIEIEGVPQVGYKGGFSLRRRPA